MNVSKSVKINDALQKMGINEDIEILYHLPRSYMDFTLTVDTTLVHKQHVVFLGKIVSTPTFSKNRNLSFVRFSFVSTTNVFIKVIAFNRPYLLKMLNFSDEFTLVGTYDKEKNVVNLINIVKGKMDEKFKPVYSLPKDIQNYTYSRLVDKMFLKYAGKIEDIIPSFLMDKYRLINKEEALRLVHHPNSLKDVTLGLRTIKFEECLMFSLQTQLVRNSNKIFVPRKIDLIPTLKINEFIKGLSFKLTHDQVVAVKEIITDMNSEKAMYRLLQGDVGTGKTLVGAIAIYGAFLRGEQSALMAPTDALAKQHFKNLKDVFKDELKVGLLVGSLSEKERTEVLKKIANHEVDAVVGTHALFSKDVEYASLGFAIIDEQHKFGVNQRMLLCQKGDRIDLLLMSATPIPRTLALTVYGEMDVTTLCMFPHGQREIETRIVSDEDSLIEQKIKESLAGNKRIFVVAPLIEYEENRDSVERLFVLYQKKYPGLAGLLHGGLPSEQKDEVLKSFYKGDKPILIATTVIEVGIDVPSANLMIIYSASNFGLSALHQLRGRIGRDGSKATCLLVDNNEDEEEKLKVLEESNDGFFIAEADLKLRGPGELMGTRQSGVPSFTYANIIDDFKMFECAKLEAIDILNDPRKENEKIISLAKKMTENQKFTNV